MAIGNDRKSATRAAARAASTSPVIEVIWRVMIGTTRIPAMQAMADPRAQLPTAIQLGLMPMAEADRSLSDTASVARPKLLDRYRAQSPAADTEAMASRMSRSAVMPTSP